MAMAESIEAAMGRAGLTRVRTEKLDQFDPAAVCVMSSA